MKNYYFAYELFIESEFILNSLPSLQNKTPDITISRASDLDTSEEFVYRVSGVARFQWQNGSHLLIQPETDDAALLELYIVGVGLGVLLHQRGLFVLHANAVYTPKGAIVICADSGIGKSTLSAALVQRGCPLICDDICAINSLHQVIPSFPQLKLWETSLTLLNWEDCSEKTVLYQDETQQKFRIPLRSTQYRPLLTSIWRIVVLKMGETLSLTPLQGVNKFSELKYHTYRDPLIEPLGLNINQLHHLTGLANSHEILMLQRPNALNTLDLMIELIMR